jgi:hypothetical protein
MSLSNKHARSVGDMQTGSPSVFTPPVRYFSVYLINERMTNISQYPALLGNTNSTSANSSDIMNGETLGYAL